MELQSIGWWAYTYNYKRPRSIIPHDHVDHFKKQLIACISRLCDLCHYITHSFRVNFRLCFRFMNTVQAISLMNQLIRYIQVHAIFAQCITAANCFHSKIRTDHVVSLVFMQDDKKQLHNFVTRRKSSRGLTHLTL